MGRLKITTTITGGEYTFEYTGCSIPCDTYGDVYADGAMYVEENVTDIPYVDVSRGDTWGD